MLIDTKEISEFDDEACHNHKATKKDMSHSSLVHNTAMGKHACAIQCCENVPKYMDLVPNIPIQRPRLYQLGYCALHLAFHRKQWPGTIKTKHWSLEYVRATHAITRCSNLSKGTRLALEVLRREFEKRMTTCLPMLICRVIYFWKFECARYPLSSMAMAYTRLLNKLH